MVSISQRQLPRADKGVPHPGIRSKGGAVQTAAGAECLQREDDSDVRIFAAI